MNNNHKSNNDTNLSPKTILITSLLRIMFLWCFLAYFDPRLPVPITPVQQEPAGVEDTGIVAPICRLLERIAQAVHPGKQEYFLVGCHLLSSALCSCPSHLFSF